MSLTVQGARLTCNSFWFNLQLIAPGSAALSFFVAYLSLARITFGLVDVRGFVFLINTSSWGFYKFKVNLIYNFLSVTLESKKLLRM